MDNSLNRGSQAYLKHFVGAFAAMGAGSMLAILNVPAIPNFLMFGALIYMVLLTCGLLLRVGPFAYIGRLYVRSAGEQGARSKSPWEQ